jgi:hypothetical protein
MAVLMGAIKISDLKQGKIFVRKENNVKVEYLSTSNYYLSSQRKTSKRVIFKVLTGPNAVVIGDTTLLMFKKEYKEQ